MMIAISPVLVLLFTHPLSSAREDTDMYALQGASYPLDRYSISKN